MWRRKWDKPYVPDEHENVVHVYRWDLPHGKEQALCGWKPPDTWHEKNGPAPLTAMPDAERCSECLDHIEREPAERYALMPPEDWIKWGDMRGLDGPDLRAA